MPVPQEIDYSPASRDLHGRAALVTGGTRGIGRGIALAVAAAGAKVVITGRDAENGQAVVNEINRLGGQGAYVAADLMDDAAVGSLVSNVIEAHGSFDILVNNAGIDADAPALDYELEAWRRILRFNLEVPFRLSQQAAKHFMQNKGGAIVNIASVLGLKSTPEASSYAAAKHGLIGLTKSLAIEWARSGVRVNAIAPGLIQTDMTKYIWGDSRVGSYAENRIPVGRIGQPRDIGGAVVFLASDAAAFMHGETIVIDGGSLAT